MTRVALEHCATKIVSNIKMDLSFQGNQVKADLVYGLKVENNYQVVKIV